MPFSVVKREKKKTRINLRIRHGFSEVRRERERERE